MPRRYQKSFICDLGYSEGTLLIARPATTPDCEPHTPMPSGYIANADWSELMEATHTCRQCRGCGLWLIYEPKEPGTPMPAAD